MLKRKPWSGLLMIRAVLGFRGAWTKMVRLSTTSSISIGVLLGLALVSSLQPHSAVAADSCQAHQEMRSAYAGLRYWFPIAGLCTAPPALDRQSLDPKPLVCEQGSKFVMSDGLATNASGSVCMGSYFAKEPR